MNLIDGYVTEIIEKKKFISPEDWYIPNVEYDIFVVKYSDDGGDDNITELWFKAEEHKDVQIGYKFLH